MFCKPSRRFVLTLTLCSALYVAGCSSPSASVQLGYVATELSGDIALDTGGGINEQGLNSAFGLGDTQGSPYLRGQVGAGGPVFTGSILYVQDSGDGQLDGGFGGLNPNSDVRSNFDLGLAKVSAAYEIGLGPVSVAPGLMVDVCALDFTAQNAASGIGEEIDELLVIPMPFVRAEAGLGAFAAVGELGYVEIDGIGDTDGAFLDAEVMLEYYPIPFTSVFVGYRHVEIDGDGSSSDDAFSADLDLQGWMIGGGIRF